MTESLAEMIHHVWQRLDPRFSCARGGRRVVVARGTRFRYRPRIRIGRRTRFLPGSVVLSDPRGFIDIGSECIVCRYAILQSVGGRITIGDRCLIGDFGNLYGHPGGLVIGSDVMLASGVRLVPESHTFDGDALAVKDQPTTSQGVRIGDGAWLGTNVVVLDGVEIGCGAVIGAGSIVTRSIPDFAIAAGAPARVIRMRAGHPLDPDAHLPVVRIDGD